MNTSPCKPFMRRKAIIGLCAGLFILSASACVRYDKKCKKDHKAAVKKGTRGWRYD